MQIQCECGKFRADISNFPKETPGRLKCYCDDCQSYLHHIKRSDLLDDNGGSEIVPNYPANLKITQGLEQLKCVRIHDKGMFRFYAGCCDTPITNTEPGRPWAGIHRRMFTAKDPNQLDQAVGDVKSGIMGKFAHGSTPSYVAKSFDLNGFKTVMPFIIKGILKGRKRPSPFFDGETPIVTPHVLTVDERANARAESGVPPKRR